MTANGPPPGVAASAGDWQARDRRALWHPFTQMTEWLAGEALVIAGGEGNELIDTNGRRYFDGVSSLWVNLHGHRHPRITQAIKEQAERLAHSTFLGLSNVPAIELAERLLAIAPPGLSRVFYSDDGSTAVEAAMKMAFQYQRQRGPEGQQRTKFIALGDAYHGDTIGSVSLGGIDLFHRVYQPLLFEVYRLPSPWRRKAPLPENAGPRTIDVLLPLVELLEGEGGKIAALVMEPLVQGAAGMLVHPRGFLKHVARLCRQHGVLLILDEVATGFGRTGTMFACEQEGVSPDLLALAKGLTGGYLPLAATLATEEIFSGFLGQPGGDRAFFHGHSYTANPLGCAAALANLDIFRDEPVLKRTAALIRQMREGLERFRGLPHVADLRQCGLMAGVELLADPAGGKPYDPLQRIGHQVILAARARGVIIRPLGDVIVLLPPLSTRPDELARLLDVAWASIAEVTGR